MQFLREKEATNKIFTPTLTSKQNLSLSKSMSKV